MYYYQSIVKFNQNSVTESSSIHAIGITEAFIRKHTGGYCTTGDITYQDVQNAITGWIAIRNAGNKYLKG